MRVKMEQKMEFYLRRCMFSEYTNLAKSGGFVSVLRFFYSQIFHTVA